jgi:glycosyltransferase involved in cell wall biosynthesis
VHLGFSLVSVRPGMVGGAESYALGLLSAYRETHGPENTTVLANEVGMSAYAMVVGNGVNLTFVPGFDPHGTTPRRAWQFARAALRRRAPAEIPKSLDLIHFPVVVPLPRTQLPTIITLHDVRHLVMPGQFTRGQRAYRRLAYDEAARRADLVLTVSEHARATIIEKLDIAPENVIAVHHGLDHSRFRPGPSDDDERVLGGLGLSRPFVVYPANLWRHKNHSTLLQAMTLLRDTDVTLILTGETYGGLGSLRADIERLDLTRAVRHIGYVAATTLPALYRNAIGLVYPSLYEGFGAPPLEAMACGCPCVLPFGGAIAEVTAGIGEVVNPREPEEIAQGIRHLLSDRASREQLVRRGLTHSAGFTWARAAQAHTEAYRHVLERRSS